MSEHYPREVANNLFNLAVDECEARARELDEALAKEERAMALLLIPRGPFMIVATARQKQYVAERLECIKRLRKMSEGFICRGKILERDQR